MPHDFILQRLSTVSNEEALILNKELARLLIENFKEITPLNKLEEIKINRNKEYPESHFQLDCDFGDFGFLMNFWKEMIIIEMSSGNNPEIVFNPIRKYSELILKKGFLIL
nr:hypothetical protein [Saprospiraceae bacterium]